MLTQEYVKQRLDYDSISGLFIWRYNPNMPKNWNSRWNGQFAGWLDDKGYVKIGLAGTHYFGHRLAWLYVFGYLPEMIDHINGNASDNRIENLREATMSQNLANSHKLVRGVFEERGRYRATIRVQGEAIHLGIYNNKELAQAAYNEAAELHFKTYARKNRP